MNFTGFAFGVLLLAVAFLVMVLAIKIWRDK